MFPGFNRRKKGTVSSGDWDRDGVRNRKDCEPLNFRKQDVSCVDCGKKIKNIDVFPGNRCVDCHEKKFDADLKKTGKLPFPEFGGNLIK